MLFKEDIPGKVFGTVRIGGGQRLRLEFSYDNKDGKPRFQNTEIRMDHTSLNFENNVLSFNLSSALINWNNSSQYLV